MNYKKLAKELSLYAQQKGYDLLIGCSPTKFTISKSLVSVVMPVYLGKKATVSDIKKFYQEALYWLDYTKNDVILSYTGLSYFDVSLPEVAKIPLLDYVERGKEDCFLLGVDVYKKNILGVNLNDSLSSHCLVSGMTGSGKSYTLMCALSSYLYHTNPKNTEVYLIDFKNRNLPPFKNLPHVKAFANDIKGRDQILEHLAVQLELAKSNATGKRYLLVVDELTEMLQHDSTQAKKWLESICRLGRELNFNVLAAAQKPSVDTLGDQIYQQFGRRITGKLRNAQESATVLGVTGTGAETLNQSGVLLDLPPDQNIRKFVSFYIKSVEDLIDTIQNKWSDIQVPQRLISFEDIQVLKDAEIAEEQFMQVFDGTKIVHGGYQKIADALGVEYKNKNRERIKKVVEFLKHEVQI